MLNKIIVICLLVVSYGFADFKGLTPDQLQNMIDKDVIVIDIRTPPEWKQTGVVPSSKKIMFFDERGGYDVQKWMDMFGKHVIKQDQPFVLVCRSGNRTGTVGSFLSKQLGFKNVYHLEHGIKSWIKEDRITIK